MGLLLAGCGAWGKNWARTLANQGELTAIVDPSEATRATMRALYPTVPIMASIDEALHHPTVAPLIEGVVIASSVTSHVSLATTSLLAGKPTLVEKPMALTKHEAQALVTLATQQGVVLAVGHLLMYHPGVLALQQAIRQGQLGNILSVQCTRYNFGTIRNEENAWWSFACHDLSIVSLLLQDDMGESSPLTPVSVSGLAMLGRHNLPDQVSAVFETPTGQSASLNVTWLHPNRKREVVVIGTKKMAILDDFEPDETKVKLLDYSLELLDADPINGQARYGKLARGASHFLPFEPVGDLLAVEAKAFLKAIRNGGPLPNDGQNALANVTCLEAVQQLLDKR
jgi:predicted dehydrogenase